MSLIKVPHTMIAGAVVSAVDYGADPTGVSDSTTAIQTALDTGKSVYLADGTYKITAALSMVGSQALFGTSRQSCVINQFTAGAIGVLISDKVYCYLHDLTVNCSATSTAAGVRIIGGGSNVIDDVLVSAFLDGIDIVSTSPARVSNAHAVNCLGKGIRVRSSGGGVPCVDVELHNCRSDGHASYAWSIEGLVSGLYVSTCHGNLSLDGLRIDSNVDGQPSQLFFEQFIADSNTQNGIYLGTTNTIELNECWASNRGSGSNCFISATAADVRIVGGKFYYCVGHGIEVRGGRCSIVGASIEDPSYGAANTFDCININGASANGTIIQGTRCFSGLNTARYGVKVGILAQNTVVNGCVLIGNVSGEYSDDSSSDKNNRYFNAQYGQTGSIADGATTDMFTLPPGAGMYLVVARQATPVNGGIRAMALVAQGSTSNAVTSLAAVSCTISSPATGFNVQIANSAGGPSAFDWSYTKLL